MNSSFLYPHFFFPFSYLSAFFLFFLSSFLFLPSFLDDSSRIFNNIFPTSVLALRLPYSSILFGSTTFPSFPMFPFLLEFFRTHNKVHCCLTAESCLLNVSISWCSIFIISSSFVLSLETMIGKFSRWFNCLIRQRRKSTANIHCNKNLQRMKISVKTGRRKKSWRERERKSRERVRKWVCVWAKKDPCHCQ